MVGVGEATLGAAAADATEIAGVNLRGLAIAVYFFSVNIAAYLISSNLIGYLSDRFGATENPAMMRYALLVCPVSCLLSAILLFTGSRTMKMEINLKQEFIHLKKCWNYFITLS